VRAMLANGRRVATPGRRNFLGKAAFFGPSCTVKALVNFLARVAWRWSNRWPRRNDQRRTRCADRRERNSSGRTPKGGPIFSAIKEAIAEGKEIESLDPLPSFCLSVFPPLDSFVPPLFCSILSAVPSRGRFHWRFRWRLSRKYHPLPAGACTDAAVILQPFTERPAKVLTDKYRNT